MQDGQRERQARTGPGTADDEPAHTPRSSIIALSYCDALQRIHGSARLLSLLCDPHSSATLLNLEGAKTVQILRHPKVEV
ncbi:hypothetical protein NPX13_g841 [Xylaria arbuscula]|uniref:Uncharacterized protein n=1 Tax=Xylaria arbuscula TaxID=114810 RepID=A0A9W8NNP2_9PEZI|nr:hypothetical protein NPX13_g841 [Xylaria arbuscula]